MDVSATMYVRVAGVRGNAIRHAPVLKYLYVALHEVARSVVVVMHGTILMFRVALLMDHAKCMSPRQDGFHDTALNETVYS